LERKDKVATASHQDESVFRRRFEYKHRLWAAQFQFTFGDDEPRVILGVSSAAYLVAKLFAALVLPEQFHNPAGAWSNR
jgi:hypothetical protein